MVFDILEFPKLKLDRDGLLSYFDTSGSRAGISLDMFEKVNGIVLKDWRN